AARRRTSGGELLPSALAAREPLEALSVIRIRHVAGLGRGQLAAGRICAGLLMMLTGAVWFCRDFDWFGWDAANRFSDVSLTVFLALIAHQVLVFPDG